MERIELIRNLNNKVLDVLNRWSLITLNGLYFDFEIYSDFCCEAKRNRQSVEMNQEEMQSVFNFFGKQFSQYKFGIAVEESKIYFGTAHLPTTELKRLLQCL